MLHKTDVPLSPRNNEKKVTLAIETGEVERLKYDPVTVMRYPPFVSPDVGDIVDNVGAGINCQAADNLLWICKDIHFAIA